MHPDIKPKGVPALARKKSSPPKKQAELDAVDALHQLDEQFLECRDLRHPFKVVGYFRDNGHVCRKLVCPRCTMEAIDTWTQTGMREPRRYYAPEGYYLSGSGVTMQDVRIEVLRRVRGHVARSLQAIEGN